MTGLYNRLTTSIFTMLGVILIVFVLFQFFGDPVKLTVGQSGNQKTADQIRHELHLDEPRWKQVLYYLNDLSPLSIYNREAINSKELHGLFAGNTICVGIKWPYLGKSYQTKKPVTNMIADSLPGTLILACTAMLIACFFGITMGIIAAVYKGSYFDSGIILFSTTGISTPSFFAALGLAYVFGIALHDYTGLNFTGNWYVVDAVTGQHRIAIYNWILPAVTLGIRPMAMITQITRSAMMDQLSMDYIRTAKAKGLPNRKIILNHAFRNALLPVATAISSWMGELLAGAFFIEYIFGWGGLGKLTIDALEKLDYPVLMGTVLTSSMIFIIIHWISDYFNPNKSTILSK